MASLAKAIALAAAAHQDQEQKNGLPYILHSIRVMLKMDGEIEMVAAILHDVVEDTYWTLDELSVEGFSPEIIELVDLLTRRENESYTEFISRIKDNRKATRVKIADLEDNMNVQRLSDVTGEDLTRLTRYHRYWMELKNINSDGEVKA